MPGSLEIPGQLPVPMMLAATPAVLSPVVILLLCVVAGVGTVMLLPSRRETAWRKIGTVTLVAAALIFGALLVRNASGDVSGGVGPYFWIFSAIALVGALRVVTHPRPVYSALYFVLTVFASAGLFVLLWAEFMAAALVLIYAGAILVTYVFVIMLAAEARTPDGARPGIDDYDTTSREPIVAAMVGFALMGMLLFLIFDKAEGISRTQPQGTLTGTTQELAAYLFQNQLVNLELAGLILTIAMVGAIIIARRRVVIPGEVAPTETVTAAATPIDDNPHSIPVYGTENPRQKAYPET
jgi:NADH-quinone oxidoreductase subunit J